MIFKFGGERSAFEYTMGEHLCIYTFDPIGAKAKGFELGKVINRHARTE